MIYRRILDLIKHQPEKLESRWGDHIRRSAVTKSYHNVPEAELAARHHRIFEHLAVWLERGLDREDLARFFTELGRERYVQGFPLSEVDYALIAARREFWALIHSEGLLDTSLELHQALELMSSIDQFFDFGAFYIIRGYCEGLHAKLREAGLDVPQIQQLLPLSDHDRHPEPAKEDRQKVK